VQPKTGRHSSPYRIAAAEAIISISFHSRRVIADHRERRKILDRQLCDRSRRGLDWTNFFLGDVQMSFGAFLAFYLASLGWSKEDVGFALTGGLLAGVAAQIPGGAAADAVRWKRGLAAAGIVMIAISALILALWPNVPLVFAAQALHGLTGGIVGPAITAISLGLAGQRGMSFRIGRNFRFAAAGNALTAAGMGTIAVYFSNQAIFLVTAALCVPTLIALAQIRPEEIDYARARNAGKRDHTHDVARVINLAKNRNLLVFAGCLLLFQFSNASLLPIVGENLGQSRETLSVLYMAALIIVPQLIVAIFAPWIGYWSEIWGRKPLFLAGLAVEAMRALLFTVVIDPRFMIPVQVLDGITGSIITVTTILIMTDITSGTGRFNLAQGLLGTLTGISAALSNSVIGTIVQRFGDVPGLLVMAAGTATAALLVWLLLPETKPKEYED
jgi:MFS family permease